MNTKVFGKWWFWVIIVLLVIAILPRKEPDSSKKETETTITEESITEPSSKYLVVSVDDLVKELDTNALKAKEKYKGEYVEITGRVNVIDADGRYISLEPIDNKWSFESITCDVDGKKQREFIQELSIGDVITLRGKIKSVDEVFGYDLEIHEFVE